VSSWGRAALVGEGVADGLQHHVEPVADGPGAGRRIRLDNLRRRDAAEPVRVAREIDDGVEAHLDRRLDDFDVALFLHGVHRRKPPAACQRLAIVRPTLRSPRRLPLTAAPLLWRYANGRGAQENSLGRGRKRAARDVADALARSASSSGRHGGARRRRRDHAPPTRSDLLARGAFAPFRRGAGRSGPGPGVDLWRSSPPCTPSVSVATTPPRARLQWRPEVWRQARLQAVPRRGAVVDRGLRGVASVTDPCASRPTSASRCRAKRRRSMGGGGAGR